MLFFSLSYNAVEKEAHFVFECSQYNPVKDKFPSLFENVVLGSLESLFESNHQLTLVSISRRLLHVPHHSRELVGLKPSRCTFNPTSLSAFYTLNLTSNSTSFHCVGK